jgi:hypothetical protein
MKYLTRACERFRNARQRQHSKLALRLRAYGEKHPVQFTPQNLPEGGLFIQFEGEAEPRTYSTHPPHEKDTP